VASIVIAHLIEKISPTNSAIESDPVVEHGNYFAAIMWWFLHLYLCIQFKMLNCYKSHLKEKLKR